MSCNYIASTVRFKGRLVRVSVCNKGQRGGHLNSARVEEGKPLDLREGSDNWVRLNKLVRRHRQVRADIQAFENLFR